MAKVCELRISVHHEGTTLMVVLDGDGVDSAQTHYPRRITTEGVAALVVQLSPMIRVALARCLRKAFEVSRPRVPRPDEP